ncbi:MAG TPA: aldo/keto reductase [Thermomicrobiales bacterium]|nr:aldo/keto reductase [Thermomicrobiales bacterium]
MTGVCLGTAPLGDMAGTFEVPGEARAVATVHAALASPIRFLDTAAGYGDGKSEERIGVALREAGGLPEGVVIGTKADPDAKTGDFSGDQCRRSIERSRQLLGLDHLPLVHLHDPEYHDEATLTQPGGAIDVLLEYQKAGIIGAVGVGGGTISVMRRFLALGVFQVMLTHNRYNLINRSGEALIDDAVGRGVAVMNAAIYGGGLLARGPGDRPTFMYKEATEQTLSHARSYEELCQRNGIPIAAAALQFSLRDPRISSTVVGTSRPERVAEIVAHATEVIPDSFWEELATLPWSTIEGV